MKLTVIGAVVCFLHLVCAQPVFAQQCTETTPITVGSKAACTGLLCPVPWSTKALRCLDVDLPKLTAENTLLSGSLAACSKRLDGLSLLCDQKLGELTTLVENSAKLNSTQWYESPVFWGIVSFVAGGAIVIGVYELAGR